MRDALKGKTILRQRQANAVKAVGVTIHQIRQVSRRRSIPSTAKQCCVNTKYFEASVGDNGSYFHRSEALACQLEFLI